MDPNVTYVCSVAERAHSLGVFYGESSLDYSFSLFLFNVILMILTYRFTRFVLKALRQPRVVSEMIAGLMIGPSVLGRSDRFSNRLFTFDAQFIISNIGALGSSLFIFLLAVKMDIFAVSKYGKKHFYIAGAGATVPALAGCVAGFMMKSSMGKNLANPLAYTAVACHLALTSFPVVYLILKELNLLSSEVGRLSLTASLITDVSGIIFFVVFEAVCLANIGGQNALLYTVSVVVVIAVIMLIIRQGLLYIIRRTPEGKQIGQTGIVMLMLMVLIVGFIGDTLGVGFGNSAFWLGLAVPDGPPLGSALTEKLETIVMEIMMPLFFCFAGLNADWSAMMDVGWSTLSSILAMISTVHVLKFLATAGAAMYFKVPLKDSIVLALVMNLKGQMEAIVNLHFLSKHLLTNATYTLFYLVTILAAGVLTPLISILYDPSRPYMISKRRTVQHTAPGSPLRVVACVLEESDVASIVNLLESSFPTTRCPFSLYALHLVELLGRANPLFVDHNDPEDRVGTMYFEQYRNVYNALNAYQEPRCDSIELQWFSAMTVKRTMYQDVCRLALTKKASLILVPFRKDTFDFSLGATANRSAFDGQSIYTNVLRNSPCSVGLMVDKSYGSINAVVGQPAKQWRKKSVMLFLGGADSREALAYADRLAENPDMLLLVVRFLALNGEGEDEMEKKLDDGVVTWFRVKNERNERVTCREVVVSNGEETMAAIHSLKDTCNDLWIVGREQGMNPVIVEGWLGWSQCPELGVVGDVISSADFDSAASILVVQQQIMRTQRPSAWRRNELPR